MLARLKAAWRVLREGAPPDPAKQREIEDALAVLGGMPLPADPTLRLAPDRRRRRYFAAGEFAGGRVTNLDLAQGCVGGQLPGSPGRMATRAHTNLMMQGQLPGGYCIDVEAWYARVSEPIEGPIADFLAACNARLSVQSKIVADANLLDLVLGPCPAVAHVAERMGWRWEIACNNAQASAGLAKHLMREEPEIDQGEIERALLALQEVGPRQAAAAPASLWPWDVRVWGEQAHDAAQNWERHATRLHDVALRASRRRKVDRALTVWLVVEGDGEVPVI